MSASLNPGITSNMLNEICQRNKSDVPKTLSNICDGTFGDNSLQFSAVNYFRKKLHHRCLTGKKKTKSSRAASERRIQCWPRINPG